MAILASAMIAIGVALANGHSMPGVEQQVRHGDEKFWQAFNRCDRAQMRALFTEDVEFYHDRTGATVRRSAVVKSLADGPCGTPGLHVRREVVAGSTSLDPVPGFGAIVTGRHRFYAKRDGQAERLDGEARFAIVWKVAHGRAQISRVLSFGHGPALDAAEPKPASLSMAMLARYIGRYATPKGAVDVTLEDGHLRLVSGGLDTDLVAITSTSFRAGQRALDLEFAVGKNGGIKLLVWENGSLVAEGDRSNDR